MFIRAAITGVRGITIHMAGRCFARKSGEGLLGATQNSLLHSTRPIATLESSRSRRAAARERLSECFVPGVLKGSLE
jgi:hypothetical protein